MTLDTVTTELNKFIRDLGNNYIKVPDYQRNYVWKTGGEIEEFWQDLEEQFEDIKKDENRNGLFLGNIILCNPNQSDVFEIVDGQQRITTIFILMIAFRSWLKKLRARSDKENITNVISRINERLIFENMDSGDVAGYRFTSASSIKSIFDYISDQDWGGDFPSKIKQKAIKRQTNKIKPIYDFFYRKIEDLLIDENDYKSFNNVINHLTFIKITLKDFQEAYLFFERTNSRGKNLEVSDLLKAHLFANHPESADIVVYWDNIAERANNNLTRMLKYFYISENGHITSSKLFNGLKTLYTDDIENNREEAAETLLLNLDDFSSFYNVVSKIESEEALVPVIKSLSSEELLASNEGRLNRIYRAIDGLNLFGVTQVVPVMWSFIKKYYSLNLDNEAKHKNTLVLFFEALESYHFINNHISNRVGNEVEKLYAEYAKNFNNAIGEYEFTNLLKGLYKALKEKIATKDEFIARFTELEYSSGSANKTIYYVLDRFNAVNKKYKKLSKSDRVKIYHAHLPFQKTDMTIEHWYPQARAKDGPDSEIPAWCNNIGNLLALDKAVNSRLGNKTPQEKYKFLKDEDQYNRFNQNRFFFESQIEKYGSFEDWDKERIEVRANLLAVEAYTKIWEFNPPILN